jgi:hypothetical protein
MKRYLIERHIPGVGSLTAAQYKDIAATSNAAVAKLAGTPTGPLAPTTRSQSSNKF